MWSLLVEYFPFINGQLINRIRHLFGSFEFFVANRRCWNIIRVRDYNDHSMSSWIIWEFVREICRENPNSRRSLVFEFIMLDFIQVLRHYASPWQIWRQLRVKEIKFLSLSFTRFLLMIEKKRLMEILSSSLFGTFSKCRCALTLPNSVFSFSIITARERLMR